MLQQLPGLILRALLLGARALQIPTPIIQEVTFANAVDAVLWSNAGATLSGKKPTAPG